MNEIFNPTLLISLGPSGRKALDFSKKLLSYLPKYLLDVIDYYSVSDVETILKDIQEIIDTRLLSAKYLNKLVDLGYKVRNDNVSFVKVNLYVLWDVYNCEHSAYEVVKTLSNLNFGNIDKDQHSGVSLYIIPLMEKEWLLEEAESLESIDKLKQIINFVSEKENMLSLDSKVYAMHCVSIDGTRIPMEELEYICGILIYLNVMPSEEPPLSHFKRRLLMNEGSYKVGTIGITTLTVFKDRLLDDFSKYMSIDILKYASQNDTCENFGDSMIFHLIKHDTQKSILAKEVNVAEENGCCKLSDIERFSIILPKNMESYPRVFKNWEEFIENQCATGMRETIDKNSNGYIEDIKQNVEEDLKHITLNYSLKEAANYLNTLKEEISKQKPSNKSNIDMDTSSLNKELKTRVDNYPNLIGYTMKCIILGVFFLYSMINTVLPRLSPTLNILFLVIFYTVFIVVAYLDYWFTLRRLNTFIERYKEEVFRRNGSLINLYIENSISNNQKVIIGYLQEKIKVLENCMDNCERASKEIVPIMSEEEENIGNLIIDLLDFDDRRGFYKEKAPRICDMYRKFLAELGGFKEFGKGDLKMRLMEFSLETSPSYIDLDFFEYIKFKYKENIKEELSKWIEKGVVKSKYLLQYINNGSIEEHSLFITSPEVYRIAKDMKSNSLSGFHVSIVQGRDVYTNCISIIRLCLGVDFENITPVKKLKRDKTSNGTNEQEDKTGGEKSA